MSTDLKYLAFTAILTASLWIPYIVCQSMTNGLLTPQNYLDPRPRPVPLWGKRADRAYLNAVESFAPFAALVIVVHLAGKANAMTAFWATAFFWLRLAHAVVLPARHSLSEDPDLHGTCVWRATREHLRRNSLRKSPNTDQGRTFHE
jgi:uncharacterized MAPEG superfamily protein